MAARRSRSRYRAAFPSSSARILFALTVLAPSSWDGTWGWPPGPRCWTSSKTNCKFWSDEEEEHGRYTAATTAAAAVRRPGRWMAGYALADTTPDFVFAQSAGESPGTPLCPVETPLLDARAPTPHPGEGPSCKNIFVTMENNSGMKISLFWVDMEGQEVLQLSAEAGDIAAFKACRAHYWRARPSSPHRRHRLLSERMLPFYSHLDPRAEEDPDELYHWEVRECVGFPLQAAFDLASSLGGAGDFELSRGTLGDGMTKLQKALVSQSTDITGAVSLTMEEAYVGKRVPVMVKRRSPCPVCNGFGAGSYITCDRCQGSGKRVNDNNLNHGDGDGGGDGGDGGDGGGESGCDCDGGGGSGGSGGGGGGGGRRVEYEFVPQHGTVHASIPNDDDDQYGLDRAAAMRRAEEVRGRVSRGGGGGGGGSGGGGDGGGDGGGSDWKQHHHGAADAAREQEGGGMTAGGGEILKHTTECGKCAGTGKIPSPHENNGFCVHCMGERFVEQNLIFTVAVAPGAKSGHTQTYPGKGHVDLTDLLAATERETETGGREYDQSDDSGKPKDTKHSGEPPSPPSSSSSPASECASKCAPRAAPEPFLVPSLRPPLRSPWAKPSTKRAPRREVKRGDYVLTVHVVPHDSFEIVRGELQVSVSLSLAEALRGFSREVTLPDGSVVTIRRTSSTLPGQLLRFPNLGLPLPSPEGHEGSDTEKKATQEGGEARWATAATGRGKGSQESTSSSATGRKGTWDGEGDTARGDLVVQASVTLPGGVGIRDDRSQFIGAFLAMISEEVQPDQAD